MNCSGLSNTKYTSLIFFSVCFVFVFCCVFFLFNYLLVFEQKISFNSKTLQNILDNESKTVNGLVLFSIGVWNSLEVKFEQSDWFFLDWDFAIWTISMGTVMSCVIFVVKSWQIQNNNNSLIAIIIINYLLTYMYLAEAILGNVNPQSFFLQGSLCSVHTAMTLDQYPPV